MYVGTTPAGFSQSPFPGFAPPLTPLKGGDLSLASLGSQTTLSPVKV